jgi:hypothetical protein
MSDDKKPCFQLEMSEDTGCFESIYFNDGHGWQELWAFEISAILDIRRQVEMMMDKGGEMAFTDLVERSKELEGCFLELVKTLKLGRDK